ncbi:MAG: envelope stress response membrane protein PspC [Rhodospirillales bacterium]|jgi:phage shock protein C|nr:envelope stress response membrane protein PspC [Rhodospirillales bacterium]MDP6884448.1 envelope stress response membrane protein PspC [Rhodospirillales bacterium]
MTDPFASRRHDSPNRLYRDPDNGPVLGVCAGLAEYFGVTPLAVRVAAVFGLVFFTLPTVIAYGAAGMFLDKKPAGLFASSAEEDFWRSVRVDPSRTVADLGHRFRDMERRLRAAEAHVTSSEFKLNRDYRDL